MANFNLVKKKAMIEFRPILRQTWDNVPCANQKGIEHLPSKCKIPYSKIWLLEKSGDILLFNTSSYKVSTSVGIMANNMHRVNCVSEKGTGPNPMREDMLLAEWRTAIQTNNRPVLKDAINEKVRVVGTITLHFRMEVSKVRVVFGAVSNFGVAVILRALSMERLVRGIFPPEHKIVHYNSKLVLILSITDTTEKLNNKKKRKVNGVAIIEADVPRFVRVARQSKI